MLRYWSKSWCGDSWVIHHTYSECDILTNDVWVEWTSSNGGLLTLAPLYWCAPLLVQLNKVTHLFWKGKCWDSKWRVTTFTNLFSLTQFVMSDPNAWVISETNQATPLYRQKGGRLRRHSFGHDAVRFFSATLQADEWMAEVLMERSHLSLVKDVRRKESSLLDTENMIQTAAHRVKDKSPMKYPTMASAAL